MRLYAHLLLVAILAHASLAARAQDVADSLTRDEALSLILPGRSASRVLFRADSRGVNAERAYDKAMDRLAQEALPDPTDPSVEAEVIRIARDRASHPEVSADFVHYYANPANMITAYRAPVPPGIRPGDSGEGRRLTWEYMLMRPPTADESPGYLTRAYGALLALQDDNSIPILARGVDAYSDYGKDPRLSAHVHRTVIDVLGSFQSARSLAAILHCVSVSANGQARVKHVLGQSFDPYAEAKSMNCPKWPANLYDKWQKVIAAYRQDPANKETLPVLHAVLSAGSIHP